MATKRGKTGKSPIMHHMNQRGGESKEKSQVPDGNTLKKQQFLQEKMLHHEL